MDDAELIPGWSFTGGHAAITKARHKTTGLLFAIKTINTGTEEDYNREIRTATSVSHPSLLPIRGCTPFSAGRQILTPFMEFGSLEDVLRAARENNRPAWWNLTAQLIVLIGIAAGIEALHDQRVVHRNVKPLNIFLDGNHQPKIGDFGISDFVTESGRIVGYCPPELIEVGEVGLVVDIFAFALIIYAVLTGQDAFDGAGKFTIASMIRDGTRPEFPAEAPAQLVELAKKCWNADPEKRPTARRVVNELARFGADGRMPELCLEVYRSFVDRMTVWRKLRVANRQVESLHAEVDNAKAASAAKDKQLADQARQIQRWNGELSGRE
jgi:serine/threonine protein kinase